MPNMRRLALYVALSLTLAVLTGYAWYRLSDTAKGWRYQDKLAGYCKGLIPYDESAVITDLEESELSNADHRLGDGLGYESCGVGNLHLTLGQIPARSIRSDFGESLLTEIRLGNTDTPTPLGGGWRGITDLRATAVVLPCSNRDASVAVSAQEIIPGGESPDRARKVAELVTATAIEAADRWSCETDRGGRIPKPPAAPKPSIPGVAKGTCKGVPFADDDIRSIQETKATGTSPLEGCLLNETKGTGDPLYELEAAFGPYAQGLRRPDDEDDDDLQFSRPAGSDRYGAWASAKCPGYGARALFTIEPGENTDARPEHDYMKQALTGFARNSAKRHHCMDLKLPPSR
jgi:hypothetical protein